LLTFLNITRAHVVGLSVGGAIALDFAIEHPEVVDCLILAAPGLSSDSKSETNLQGLKALTNLVKTNGLDKLIELTLDAPFVLSKQNDVGREKVRQIYLDNADVFESGFPVYALWEPLQPPPEDRLATVRARVLIIRGDSDSPVYASMTDKISNGIPNATTVVIPGGTHFLNLEKPAEFNEALRVFLTR
jgi:pimeloyl-ACP methyl ester carboxylesterase